METAYSNDPRVAPSGHEWFTVHKDGRDYWVNHPSPSKGWAAYDRESLTLVGSGFPGPDEAIASLIGPPAGRS